MAPTNMQYALKYLRMGFSVIPCRRDKKSLIKWEPYQLQKPTQDEIRKWWTEHPDANIAIVCGAVSGIDVLDCDSQEAYDNVNEDFAQYDDLMAWQFAEQGKAYWEKRLETVKRTLS